MYIFGEITDEHPVLEIDAAIGRWKERSKKVEFMSVRVNSFGQKNNIVVSK